MFKIDPVFKDGAHALGELGVCHAVLIDNAHYPWIVLIPRIDGARELEDVPRRDRERLMDEILAAGRAVRAIGEAVGLAVTKLNVGQIGNRTPQLHIHVVGRRADDPAWPGPVWGHPAAEPYPAAAIEPALAAARQALGLGGA